MLANHLLYLISWNLWEGEGNLLMPLVIISVTLLSNYFNLTIVWLEFLKRTTKASVYCCWAAVCSVCQDEPPNTASLLSGHGSVEFEFHGGVNRLFTFWLRRVTLDWINMHSRMPNLFVVVCLIVGHLHCLAFFAQSSKANGLHPVIIVPGTGGSQLEARLTDRYKNSSLFCRRRWWEKDWFRIWFDISVILPPLTECFADRISLVYDPDTDEYYNAPGVEIRVPDFGTTKAMQYLDPSFKSVTAYMSSLVQSIEDVGYVDGKSLFGAPYDFRYGPGKKSSSVGSTYVQDLRKLVEEAYASNSDKEAILVSHSLGGLWVLYFLNQQPLPWRQKFIKHFIAISAPWGGTVQEMRTLASGYSLGIPLLNPMVVRGEQRTSESNIWLLPVPEVFGNRTLIITEERNYTASDIIQFLHDIGLYKGIAPYKSRIRPLTKHLVAPIVPVTFIFGTGIGTPETLIYGKHGFDQQPEIIEGDGDGTVNLCSLSAAISDWAAIKGQKMKVVRIPHSTHNTILTNHDSLKIIVNEILSVSLHKMHSDAN